MITYGDNGIIGGWAGDILEYANMDAAQKVMAIMGFLGTIALYVSLILVVVGFYCIIFNYRKPLKIGLIGFLVSIICIMIGGLGA